MLIFCSASFFKVGPMKRRKLGQASRPDQSPASGALEEGRELGIKNQKEGGLKGEFTFFIRELDVPPLGESNLIVPKKSVEVKFFKVAFFGVHPTLSIAPNVIN